ncbi:DNA-binding response regulator [Bradyrhizobium centrolobii]|uniref:Regulatory protein VirG n=1 Tax=Bradyrhizobium centrolobii TaxID=1505087 RepID=A0A176Z707_9BRAD|nr:winged helix-turn-helix domain-containing protein [Bradyrhizobium centrolobii]OAF15542.1 DNA-binding response regulator [Bradyrhizobium centrolobii]
MNQEIGATGYILIINNDPLMRQAVSSYFSDHNFPTSCLPWSEWNCTRTLPSLIIMDQPHDGLDRLRSIRSRSDIPIIITGNRADEVDSVVSLELGADDYIVKPSPRELLARARAILRRRQMSGSAQTRVRDGGGYRFNGWRLERYGRRLVDSNETPVSLTKGEYALLLAFLEAPERPLSREHLLNATRFHEDIFDRSVDVQVLRLRRKLEIDPNAPRMIQTERGIGYVFALPVERF